MERDGRSALAIAVLERQIEAVRDGRIGLLSDADITPYHAPRLAATVADDAALDTTAVIRLNGGLGTSMGMHRAKSLLKVRDGLTFLDIIARQVSAVRQRTRSRLPICFLHSFRTSDDCLDALGRYPDLADAAAPIEMLQHRVPKLSAVDLTPISWPPDPELESCPG